MVLRTYYTRRDAGMGVQVPLLLLPRWRLALWWLALLAVHGVAAAYNLAYALFYWQLSGTYLNTVLEFMLLGMPPPYHCLIAAVHGVLGGFHALSLLLMCTGSIRWRSLRFTPLVTCSGPSAHYRRAQTSTRGRHPIAFLASLTRCLYYKLLHRDGFFGVQGKHFHRVQTVREVVEIVMRSIQAYRMSAVLPRASVNQFFVALLVINSCSPLVLHHVLRHDERCRRLARLVLDLILDLVASVGIPVVTLANYVGAYDFEMKGFPTELWYDDYWAARAMNELQLLLVMSGADLFSRVWFSMGILSTSTNIKIVLGQTVAPSNRVVDTSLHRSFIVPGVATSAAVLPVAPTEPKKASSSDKHPGYVRSKMTQVVSLASVRALEATAVLEKRVKLRFAYYVLALWGIVVLGFHTHAEAMPALPQCGLQVRPWGVAQPSCYLVEVNCYRLGIDGSRLEIAQQWSAFDRSTAVQMLVKHCPALEIPVMLQDFSSLNGLKVYNSTIVEWGADSELTREHHPLMITVFLVRVNMTNGEIPAGLLGRDFPPMLRDFEFVVTNLRTFPDDLDELWPVGSMVYAEFSALTELPASLVRLQPVYLSVYGSPISSVPVEAFQGESLVQLHLGRTLVTELPRNVTALSPALSTIYVVDTNVSSFWSWADSSPGVGFIAGGTAYCDSLKRFAATSDRSGFPSPAELASDPDYSALMDPTQSQLIQARVDCNPIHEGFYPLAVEDANSELA